VAVSVVDGGTDGRSGVVTDKPVRVVRNGADASERQAVWTSE
jgi:hypothetical protein